MKSDIHLQLHDSRIKRITILQSAKTLAETLRTFSSFKRLREDKMKNQLLLEDCLFQVRTAFNEIKMKDVPFLRVSSRGEERVEVPQEIIVKPVAKPVDVPRIDKKDLELLQQLQDIEQKLSSLST